MRARFGVEVGLSDHTLGVGVSTAAVVLGATMIEKHLTLDRADGGPDAGFSLHPDELATMVEATRQAREAVGLVGLRSQAERRAKLEIPPVIICSCRHSSRSCLDQ